MNANHPHNAAALDKFAFNPDWLDNPRRAEARRHVELSIASAIESGSFPQFVRMLARRQIEANVSLGSDRQVVGISFRYDDFKFSSAALGYSWKQLSIKLRYSAQHDKATALSIAGGSVIDVEEKLAAQYSASLMQKEKARLAGFITVAAVMVLMFAGLVVWAALQAG